MFGLRRKSEKTLSVPSQRPLRQKSVVVTVASCYEFSALPAIVRFKVQCVVRGRRGKTAFLHGGLTVSRYQTLGILLPLIRTERLHVPLELAIQDVLCQAHKCKEMWLDRFSGQSTPSGTHSPNRAYSPAPPRRPSHLTPRSGLGLRDNRSSTSLDLSANVSTVSLGSNARHVNGSGLRYEQKPPPDVADPQHVLKDILRLNRDDAARKNKTSRNVDDGISEDVEIDFGSLSLQEFNDQRSRPSRAATLPVPGISRKRKLEDFHRSISDADQVLKNVEVYLTNFKAELGQVSAEIENLQSRSIQLNARLDNRRQVEKLLGPAVEDASISPVTVRAIAEGPIDDSFTKALHELEARSTLLEKNASSTPIKALEDVKPLLSDLQSRAVERIRDFVVAQIKSIRSPNINAQVIQQQCLVKYSALFAFLSRYNPVLSEEIGQAYINTMKWYYLSNFTRYQTALAKIPLHNIDGTDLLGSDPSTKKTTTKTSGPQHDPLSLNKRAYVLTSSNTTAIPAHLAEDAKHPTNLETPFLNLNLALLDNATSEYTTCQSLFPTSTYQSLSRTVLTILEPTLSLAQTFTSTLIANTTDSIGILLCIRLNQKLAFELQRRKLPILDNYINYTNILLWPRLQQTMDLHTESLKKVSLPNTGRAAALSLSLITNTPSSSDSLAPHPITQRFATFLTSLLASSTSASADEPLSNSLIRLRNEYESLMTKLSKSAGDKAKQARFLANNYSLVLTILGDVSGKLAEDMRGHFEGLVRESNGRGR
jgi:vacuolar protein sorting-associated protein 52